MVDVTFGDLALFQSHVKSRHRSSNVMVKMWIIEGGWEGLSVSFLPDGVFLFDQKWLLV